MNCRYFLDKRNRGMYMTKGKFIISLDFELNWGIHDVMSIEEYQKNLLGTREAIDKMLRLFEKYSIRVTWATVGFLFLDTKEQLMNYLPDKQPTYKQPDFSPYPKIEEIGESELADPYHYAKSVIEQISKYDGQEIATHTFSHYYCLEKGQTKSQFAADLKAAVQVAKEMDYTLRSIVFPRNQINEDYLVICEKYGITNFRGNPSCWLFKETPFYGQSQMKRLLRLVDSYINLSGHHTYPLHKQAGKKIYDIKGSYFFRPYSGLLFFAERLKINRIKKGIKHAVKKGEVYHIWWHPHNFGDNIEQNLAALEEVLECAYHYIQSGQLVSVTMEEASELIETTTMIPKKKERIVDDIGNIQQSNI